MPVKFTLQSQIVPNNNKSSSLYRQVLLITEGYHKSNHKATFLSRAFRRVTGITFLSAAELHPARHTRLAQAHMRPSAAPHLLPPLALRVHTDYSMFLNELKAWITEHFLQSAGSTAPASASIPKMVTRAQLKYERGQFFKSSSPVYKWFQNPSIL